WVAPRQAKADVVGNAEVGKERSILRHIADLAAMRRNRLRPIGQELSVEHDFAGIRRIEAGDDAQQRRLARPARSHHGAAATGSHAEIDAVERRNGAVAAADALKFKQAHRLAAGFEYMYSNDVSGSENNTMIRA